LFDYILSALDHSVRQVRLRDTQLAAVAAAGKTSLAAAGAAKAQQVPGAEGLDLDGLVYVDLDGVAEAVDVLRGLQSEEGRAAKNSAPAEARGQGAQALLEEATDWLIRQQMPSGEWPQIWHPDDPLYTKGMFETAEADSVYNRLHPVWTCTYALCDRPPQARDGSPYAARMERLMQESSFATRPTPVNKSSGGGFGGTGGGKHGKHNRAKTTRQLNVW
jgi:hypothetical protein